MSDLVKKPKDRSSHDNLQEYSECGIDSGGIILEMNVILEVDGRWFSLIIEKKLLSVFLTWLISYQSAQLQELKGES